MYFLDKKYVPVITEDGKDVTSSAVMLDAMKKVSKKGILVSCHCEDPFLSIEAKGHRQIALELAKKFKICN